VGPLFSMMDSSECTPTNSSLPSWRACSMAPAWPVSVSAEHLECGSGHTMVSKVETAIDPYALLRNLDVFLRVHRPLSLCGNPLSLCFVSCLRSLGGGGWCRTRALCLRCIVTWGSWRGWQQHTTVQRNLVVMVCLGESRTVSNLNRGTGKLGSLELGSSTCHCWIQPNVLIAARGQMA